jgi:hypothetical protein
MVVVVRPTPFLNTPPPGVCATPPNVTLELIEAFVTPSCRLKAATFIKPLVLLRRAGRIGL